MMPLAMTLIKIKGQIQSRNTTTNLEQTYNGTNIYVILFWIQSIMKT